MTAAGKYKASLNSLKSGIQCNGLLPCKKERCYFYINDLCDFVTDYGQDGFANVDYGSPCPTEIIIYTYFAIAYGTEVQSNNSNVVDMLYKLILTELQQIRRQKLSAIEADIVRDVSRTNHGGLAISQRYRKGITKRKMELLAALFPRVS